MSLLPAHAEWFARERGIRRETLERFGVYSKEHRVVLPYGPKMHKERPVPAPLDGERRFYFHPVGSKPPLYNLGDATKEHVFLVEGETDAMRLWQELHDSGADHIGVVAISGLDNWNDAYAVLLRDAEHVYVVLDNDADYIVQAKVEQRWLSIHRALGRKALRVKLPGTVKDICEFFGEYTLDGLRTILDNAERTSAYYTPLDLLADPPPADWLVDGLICRGDIGICIGEPGAGKSWLSMDLTVAVAEGREDWLGQKLRLPNGYGRVLYVDEENPIDVPPRRLRQLGMTPEGAARIRFLHRCGVRLDRQPGLLLDEALTWGADLIVLDSLTRVHTKNENDAGEMSRLFNDGIVPLARDTGAALLVLHHVNKSEGNSSFGRVRGSSDIPGVVDVGLDVRAQGLDRFTVAQFKTRRGQLLPTVEAARRDMGGSVEIVLSPAAPI